MLFSKKLSVKPYSEYIIKFLNIKNNEILTNTDDSFSCKIRIENRGITINLTNVNRGSIMLDVIDAYAIIRIPREKFNKIDEFKEYCLNRLYILK